MVVTSRVFPWARQFIALWTAAPAIGTGIARPRTRQNHSI